MKFLVFIIFTIFLTSCTSHNLQIYSNIDKNNKTITVPPGSKGLKGKLKKVLSEEGWKLVVYRGPSITEGTLGEKTTIKQYDTFNTKYLLVVVSKQFDICLNLSPAIIYDISLIDNTSGMEVFTLDGKGCESEVIKKFKNALNGINE